MTPILATVVTWQVGPSSTHCDHQKYCKVSKTVHPSALLRTSAVAAANPNSTLGLPPVLALGESLRRHDRLLPFVLFAAGPIGMGVAVAIGLFDCLESVAMVPTHVSCSNPTRRDLQACF